VGSGLNAETTVKSRVEKMEQLRPMLLRTDNAYVVARFALYLILVMFSQPSIPAHRYLRTWSTTPIGSRKLC
jgi:hypothetical protein